MPKYNVAYYFKAAMKMMPDELNTSKQINDYIKKSLKEAKQRAEDASWRTLFMSYEMFCVGFGLDENNNKFKKMWSDCYADDSYEVEFRYMDNPDKDPKAWYNNGCWCHFEIKFEYQNPKNKKNYKLTRKSVYNTSSMFAAWLSDNYENYESEDDSEDEEEDDEKKVERMVDEQRDDKEKKKEETKTNEVNEDVAAKIRSEAKQKHPNDPSAQLRYVIEKDGKRLRDTFGIHFG
jgi:hypothetical protein